MKRADKLKYPKKKRLELLEDAIYVLGKNASLTICMEEVAELIDVIAGNVVDKVDYIHTAEEIADVLISVEYMKLIYGISKEEIDDVKKTKMKKKNIALCTIITLANAQQTISKTIRRKSDSYHKIVPMVQSIIDCAEASIKLFKIKKKDIARIQLLKYKRLEERLINGELS